MCVCVCVCVCVYLCVCVCAQQEKCTSMFYMRNTCLILGNGVRIKSCDPAMEVKQSRRSREQDGHRQGGGTKKKGRKGILKNGPNADDGRQPDYDVPNCKGSRKSRRNSNNSCGSCHDGSDVDTCRHVAAVVGNDQGQPPGGHQNIYDTPKTPAVKWKEELAAAYDMVSSAKRRAAPIVSAVNTSVHRGQQQQQQEDVSFYENIGYAEDGGRVVPTTRDDDIDFGEDEDALQGLYDYPRARAAEAIYINDTFDDEMPAYDTPRKSQEDVYMNDEDIDCIECDYDVPKAREAILTPIAEEDGQEYDVPRSSKILKLPSDEQIYENQPFVGQKQDAEPIYMNEMSGDDRSSGYRSSSSPSIHSEENLYANESAGLSMEEPGVRSSRVGGGMLVLVSGYDSVWSEETFFAGEVLLTCSLVEKQKSKG